MKTIIFIVSFLFTVDVFSQQCQNDSTGMIPISDLGSGVFNGMMGGLYGNGDNQMPLNHLQAGIQLASTVVPLDNAGNFNANGKVGFISMGMSNANIFFAGLRDSSIAYSMLNPRLVMVNGATGGKDIDNLLDTNDTYWTSVNQKMAQAQLTNAQVQVIWFQQAKHISGIPPGEGLAHIDTMERKFLKAFQYFKTRYPNLKQIFCSGRDYGGYSNPGLGNPEPYAYYTGWSFRKLVERQIQGDTSLSFIGSQPKTAWLAWSGYMWADGINLRNDGFNWLCPQDVQSDGVHPNAAGKAKVASILFNFFKSDTTTFWYRNNSVGVQLENHENIGVFRVYPNPATEFITIISENPLTRLVVYDSMFRLIRVINSNESNIHVNISEFPSGIYRIIDANNPETGANFIKR
jgi:hypothetical protein